MLRQSPVHLTLRADHEGDSGGTTSGLFYGSYGASLLGFLSSGGSGDCYSTRAGNQLAKLGVGEYILK